MRKQISGSGVSWRGQELQLPVQLCTGDHQCDIDLVLELVCSTLRGGPLALKIIELSAEGLDSLVEIPDLGLEKEGLMGLEDC